MAMSGLEFSWSWDFAVRFLSIALIDLALSGDNAIIIGMAAASLPAQKRKLAIAAGGIIAILLRIMLTTVATLLMRIPLLSAAGGVVLFWVVWKLLRIDMGGSEEEKAANASGSFRQAIFLIVTADFMMSVDNVIAVAGTAHGSIVLLIAGLLLSMPLLMVSGSLVSRMIDKFKWLVIVGAMVISFTGTRMIFEDRLIEARLHAPGLLAIGVSVLVGLLFPHAVIMFNRWRATRALTAASERVTK